MVVDKGPNAHIFKVNRDSLWISGANPKQVWISCPADLAGTSSGAMHAPCERKENMGVE